ESMAYDNVARTVLKWRNHPDGAHNLKVVGSNPTPATNATAALWGGFFVSGPASFVINILDPLIHDKSLLRLRFDGIVGYLSETQQP
ncbi:MAG: hypothetical protein AAGK28_07125, partial [Pseudomonadota bacterium]